MSGLIEHVSRFEVVQLEAIFNEDVACEHAHHNEPALASQHGGPGEYLLVLCNVRLIVCGPLAAALLAAGGARCPACFRHPVTAGANLIKL